jgi:hypothetical protein
MDVIRFAVQPCIDLSDSEALFPFMTEDLTRFKHVRTVSATARSEWGIA